MIRKIMRNARRRMAERSLSGSPALVGTKRAGMHQKAEHEYQRSRMADQPVTETPEDALDMPAAVEAEIPPEEEDDEDTAELANGEAEISPDEEILDDIAEAQTEPEEETEEVTLSVDYSGERIPVIEPVTGGNGTDESAELIYSSGDGSLKEIQEPLPGIGEKLGIPPLFNGVPDPSANVAAYEDPAPEPDPVDPVEPEE